MLLWLDCDDQDIFLSTENLVLFFPFVQSTFVSKRVPLSRKPVTPPATAAMRIYDVMLGLSVTSFADVIAAAERDCLAGAGSEIKISRMYTKHQKHLFRVEHVKTS